MPSLYSIHQAKALRLAAESEDWSKAMGTVRVLIIDGAAKVAGAPAGNVLDNTKYLYPDLTAYDTTQLGTPIGGSIIGKLDAEGKLLLEAPPDPRPGATILKTFVDADQHLILALVA